MEIEQRPPHNSSFGRVLAITAAALILIFAIAYFFLHKDHAVPGRYNKYPTSELQVARPVVDAA